MGDFGVGKMFGQITEGEEKVATDTSLAVDEILKNVSLYVPAALLAITFIYTPELTKSGSVQCFHMNTQGWTEMLYVNNYCWENLEAYSPNLDETNIFDNVMNRLFSNKSVPTSGQAIPGENLEYHKSFTLVMLLCIFLGLLPSIIWSVIDFDQKIKAKADYIEMGIEEALQLVLRQMVSLVKAENESEKNETEGGVSVKDRLTQHIRNMHNKPLEENPFANTEVKFEGYQKMIRNSKEKKKLSTQYMIKRLITMLLLILISVVIFGTFVVQTTDQFDCKVPMSPQDNVYANQQLTDELQKRQFGVERTVTCTLEGVVVRRACGIRLFQK